MPCCGGPGWIKRTVVDNAGHADQVLVSRGFQNSRFSPRKKTRSVGGEAIPKVGLAELQQLVQDHVAGRLNDPLHAYREMHDRGMQHPLLSLNLAQLELASGALDRADQLLDQTLAMQDDLAAAWALQGTVKRRSGDLQASIDCLHRALALDADLFAAWLTLSVVLYDQSSYQDALSACERACELEPRSAAAHANHSMIHLALGDSLVAEQSARLAVELDPLLPEAYLNLGNALHAQEQWQAAIEAHQEAIRLRPHFPPALSSLGNALRAADRLEEAKAAFCQAIHLDSDYFQAYSNLAITQRALGQLDAALATCQLAFEKSPLNADIHSNLGVIQHERGAWEAAEASLSRALEIAPQHAESHFSLAAVLLQQGVYEQGWQEYEWRFTHNARHPIMRELAGLARWLGPAEQPQLDEIVLLHEQGLGDSFQFIRFAPLLRQFAKRVVMTCPKPLMSLFAASGLVDQVVPLDADLDQFSNQAVWLPLMSLPGLLRVPECRFSDNVPFLPIDPGRRAYWSEKLHGMNDLLIALNWQGNPEHEKTTSRGRSIPLEAFAPLAALPGVRFLSLQKGFGSEQLETCSFRDRFVDCQREIDAAWDFEDAAALMDCATVVISSDTSAAHLAGAIGARLWMPLKRVPEWRWGTDGTTTPWYPTATLFRQQIDGDWSAPVERMRCALEKEIMISSSRTR